MLWQLRCVGLAIRPLSRNPLTEIECRGSLSSHPTRQIPIMRTKSVVTLLFVFTSACSSSQPNTDEQPWISLFDGKTLNKAIKTEGPVKIVDGRLELTKPGRLDYECGAGDFLNFDFVANVLTEPGAKCGIPSWKTRGTRHALSCQGYDQQLAQMEFLPVSV